MANQSLSEIYLAGICCLMMNHLGSLSFLANMNVALLSKKPVPRHSDKTGIIIIQIESRNVRDENAI